MLPTEKILNSNEKMARCQLWIAKPPNWQKDKVSLSSKKLKVTAPFNQYFSALWELKQRCGH
jgi:hypothetical protein